MSESHKRDVTWRAAVAEAGRAGVPVLSAETDMVLMSSEMKCFCHHGSIYDFGIDDDDDDE